MSGKPFSHLRRHFMAGIAVGAPVVLTLWLVWSAILMIDGWIIPAIPHRTLPEDSILRIIPGVGVLIFFVSTVLLGVLAKGILGRWIVRVWDRLFDRLPIIRAIYSSLKQITEVVLGQDVSKFETACLVRYPHERAWAVGFISTPARGEISRKLSSEEDRILSVFIPTTPNPTSGFLLFVPSREVIELDMGVDDAVKLVISAGLVCPDQNIPKPPGGEPDPCSFRGGGRDSPRYGCKRPDIP